MGVPPLNRAVFLDRDGVLNEATVSEAVPHPPQDAADFRFLPGVADACRRLREANFTLIVVTNQPDVARGTQSLQSVEAMNAKVRRELPVQDVLTCFHDDADHCDCRKPKPGLLLRAAKERAIDLKSSFMVGDRWRDVEAGRAAGCASILIERDYSRKDLCRPDFIARDLPHAAQIILDAGAHQ
ncbi:MAG: D-glycero-alpha-D-manno-heptose-1,7-bisphosphate 7-phosphatase [Elusimicrobiota bacterium]